MLEWRKFHSSLLGYIVNIVSYIVNIVGYIVNIVGYIVYIVGYIVKVLLFNFENYETPFFLWSVTRLVLSVDLFTS